jgi:hypothetical protein
VVEKACHVASDTDKKLLGEEISLVHTNGKLSTMPEDAAV